jgi:hypothetical protein
MDSLFRGVTYPQQPHFIKILKPVIKAAKEHYGKEKWIFQHDGAPSHRAEDTQDWLAAKKVDFIHIKSRKKKGKYRDEWPPNSPDLNPVDFCVNAWLSREVGKRPHKTVASLQRAISRAWDRMPMKTLRRAMDAIPKRLQQCVKAKGARFE